MSVTQSREAHRGRRFGAWRAAIFCLLPMFGVASAAIADSLAPSPSPGDHRAILPVVMLDAAVNAALRYSSEIAAARHEIDAADATILQAGTLPNPEAAFLLEDLRKETRTTTFQINQMLELGGKRAARVAAAERGRDVAVADRQAKITEVRANAMAAFFDVLAAQERRTLATAALTLAEHATTTAARRVTAGKISPVEETKARVAQAGVQLELRQADAELDIARHRLCALWGRTDACFERAAGRFDDIPALPPLADLMARLEEVPAVTRARTDVAQREAQAEVERSRRMPNVTVSAGVKRAEDLGRTQAVLGVSIPLPLFDRNQGNVLEALRRADRARDDLAVVRTRAATELHAAYAQWTAAQEDIRLLQDEMLPGAQSAYDAAVKGFEYGKFGFLDVLDAQRTLLQAQSQYLHALSTAHRLRAAVLRLVGDLSGVPSHPTSPTH